MVILSERDKSGSWVPKLLSLFFSYLAHDHCHIYYLNYGIIDWISSVLVGPVTGSVVSMQFKWYYKG